MKLLLKTSLVAVIAAQLLACSQQPELVATVGDKSLTQKEFSAYLKFMRIDANDQNRKNAALEQWIEREKLAQAITNQKDYNADLIAAELNNVHQQMVISRYFETYLDSNVSENELKNYYSSNPDQYQSKKVKVAHILLRTNDSMDDDSRRAKYNAAHEAYSKIKRGDDFAQVAKDYSEDKISLKNDGLIGWVQEGAIDPIFSQKVFTELKSGEVSEPFHTHFGYHVVKVMEGPAVMTKPFEKAKGDIRYQLRKQHKSAETERLMGLIKATKH
jgi:peptidyl-prolyl cis-trans isomerase C